MLDSFTKIDRRSFLTLCSAGALSIPEIVQGRSVFKNKPKLGKIALQLYSVRREISNDLEGTLERIAAIGFTRVETAFWPDHISLKQASQALKKFNIKVCAAHCEIPMGKERSKMLDIAEAFDCNRMIWHGWPEDSRYLTADGVKQLAEIYNRANHFANQHGLLFGLHNHWWEFRNQIDGQYPYQVLLPLLDEQIFFELDTYWIKVAGLDPAKIVGQFGGKAPLLHIKDGPARYSDTLGKDEPEPMVAIGQGTQNFHSIVEASKNNTQWMVVEMDKTDTDVFKALDESYRYLIENKLATND